MKFTINLKPIINYVGFYNFRQIYMKAFTDILQKIRNNLCFKAVF